jgi:LuxR family maltose regulon positive regulatory protein
VLLAAPPGFGKTVVLTAAYRARLHEGSPAAWFSLDESDGPETVLRYLEFAFRQSGLPVAVGTDSDARETFATRLQATLRTVEQCRRRALLVIDDVDRAPSEVLDRVIEPLLRFLPDNVTLALASRRADEARFLDVEQRGLLVRIGPAQLRFTRGELREFWGRSLTEPQLRAVERRSGGWPALLQLMLRQRSAPEAPTGDGTREPGGTYTFIEARLLARLEPATRAALARLSLLERFTPALVRQMTDAALPEALLAELEAAGLIERLHAAGEPTYALNALVRDCVARRFQAEESDTARECHAEAARLFLERGEAIVAVRHAAATRDPALTCDVAEAVDPLLLGIRDGFARMRQLVRAIPAELASARPRIGYAFVADAIKAGRLREAGRLFDTLERAFPAAAGGTAIDSVAAFERAICRTLLAVYKGTAVDERDIAALHACPGDGRLVAPMVRSLAETLRSFIESQQGRFGDAKASAERALRHAIDGGSPYAAFFMYCDLGMMSGVQGDVAGAEDWFERGVEECAPSVRADYRLSVIRDAFRLELEHERRPGDGARRARLKNLCARLPSLEGWIDVYAAAFRTYSEALYLAGDLPAGLAVLTAGIEHLHEQDIEVTPWVLVAQRALLLALGGDVAAARTELATVPDALGTAAARDGQPWRLAEVLVEARTLLALAAGERVAPAELITGLERARASGNVRSEIRFRRLARAFVSGRSVPPAEDPRLDALEDRTGFRRAAVLYVPDAGAGRARLADAGAVPAAPPRRPGDFLSDREVAILGGLERGLSDKAIALELGISAHGVRYHLKRMYAKLHAGGREQAVTKARRLGIRLAPPPTTPPAPPY